MNYLVLFVIFVVVTLLIGQIVAFRSLRLATPSDATEWVETPDGWHLPLYRYRPAADPNANASQTRARAAPVILCHGLGANRFNLDFDETLSLARYLRARGRDVFVLELRGIGNARFAGGAKTRWSFDDYVRFDVPAALQRVRAITGARAVDWIGHSMGGMVMYAALAVPDNPARDDLRALVAIGSPAAFEEHRWLRPIMLGTPLLTLIPPPIISFFIRLLSPFVGWFNPPFAQIFANLKNVDGRVARRAAYNLFGASAPGVMLQFSSFVRSGKLQSVDRQVDYSDGYRRIDKPLLLFAGNADWLAPVSSVRYLFERAASANKVLVECGVANGFGADYGHGDLMVGRAAPTEIFPRVEAFLAALDLTS